MSEGVWRLAEMTWPEVRDLDRGRSVAILPIGAIEAHGPHLPLATDRVIALAMAEEGARRLAAAGWIPLVLPPIDYTAASFAAGFPGTVSLRPETVAAVIVDLAASLARWGIQRLAIANAHFDPDHLRSLHAAVATLATDGEVAVVFPDVTRKPWALRLGDEFRSGACHGGRYEGSVVMAERPELVREAVRRELAANPVSLSVAIRDGHRSFEEAGGTDAYFGDPAAASAAEGEVTVRALGEILAEAVSAALTPSPSHSCQESPS